MDEVDGRKAVVAGADAVVAVLLQGFEECHHERSREVLHHQGARTAVEPFRRVENEKLEALGVALNGVTAEVPFARQMFLQESGEVGGEVSHGNLRCSWRGACVLWPRQCRVAGQALPPGTSRFRRH